MNQEPTIHLVANSVMTHALHMIPLYNHVLTKALRHVHFPGFSSLFNYVDNTETALTFFFLIPMLTLGLKTLV